ncbi:MAG: zinc-binding protein [Candidatus Riflebacteria bacterium]|nr:zinc-binding protein [Candidatus Riflebacteria bacterium]
MPDLLDLLRNAGLSPARHGAREWSAPCPRCGGRDRFRLWPDRGRWYCRACDRAGDAVDLLRLLDPALTYPAACRALGIEPRPMGARRRPAGTLTWTPREEESPAPFWWYAAGRFVAEAHDALMQNHERLAWLREARGLTPETARRARLGWHSRDRRPPREEWGLEPAADRPRGLWLPAGLVLPTMNGFGSVVRLAIRRPEGAPRYLTVEGGNQTPLVAGDGTAGAVVIESALDALLIAQEAGDLVKAVALGSAVGRPDLGAHKLLTDGRLVLVALDADRAGAAAWAFWRETYPRAIRWPTPRGKDPADAWQAGLSIRAWVVSGLRAAAGIPSGPAVDEERAAILEYDAGLPREEAERLALGGDNP